MNIFNLFKRKKNYKKVISVNSDKELYSWGVLLYEEKETSQTIRLIAKHLSKEEATSLAEKFVGANPEFIYE